MRDLDGQPRLATDRDDLVDGLPLRSVLAPDVADVSPARSRRDLRERHHFRRRRVDAGIVFESGRETERASSHLGTEQFLHAAHFVGRRRSFEVVAHHLLHEDRRVLGEEPDVGSAHALLEQLDRDALLDPGHQVIQPVVVGEMEHVLHNDGRKDGQRAPDEETVRLGLAEPAADRR